MPYRTGQGVLGAIRHLPVVGSLLANVPGCLTDIDPMSSASTALGLPMRFGYLQATSSHVNSEAGHAMAADAPIAP